MSQRNKPKIKGQVGFIGRKHELALIKKLVKHEKICFLLISGDGGIGKTRLLNEISDRYGDNNQLKITNMLQVMSQINGVDRLKNELRKAFESHDLTQIMV